MLSIKKYLKKIETKEDLPSLSLPTPDRIEVEAYHVFEASLFLNEANITGLIELMFAHPERTYHLYSKIGDPNNEQIKDKLNDYGILSEGTDLGYYKMSNEDDFFIKIDKNEINFDYEQELFDKGITYARDTLKLSEALKRKLTIEEHLQTQKESEKINPIEAKLNIWFFTVDLFNLRKWICRRLNRKKKAIILMPEKLALQQLKTHLWGSANLLRGSI